MSSLKNLRSLASLASVVGLLALSGCATGNKDCCSTDAKPAAAPAGEKAAAPAAAPSGRIVVVNTVCPIGGDDFETKDRPASLARTVNGQNVGFCCDHCTAKFDKMDDAGKANVLKTAMANGTMK